MNLVVIVMLSLCLAAVPARAASVSVFVGYADNLRPTGFFPTPWLGDPNVVSQTPTGQSLDAGAIRIDNTSGASMTISDMTATFNLGTQVFDFWVPLVIPNGDTGIFTQTGSYNFDTSDFGYFGAGPVNVDGTHPLGGCTNPQTPAEVAGCASYSPVVSFSTDGGATTLSFTDSGHILDTFGYDLINLPPPGGDGNESINWNLIGTGSSRSGSVPEPGTWFLMAPLVTGALLLRKRLVRS